MAISKVLINWTYGSADNTSYSLQRSSSISSVWSDLASTILTNYTDSAVNAGTTYWYKVAATNPFGTGSFSATSSAAVITI